MRSNVVLTGFMGTGKTSIGKILAVKLGCAFVDIDLKIEQEQSMKIPDIFKKYSEKYFRELECRAVEEVSMRRGIVIATGGGTLENPANMKLLKETGILICLTADVDEIIMRTQMVEDRPVLLKSSKEAGDRRTAILKLLAKRQHNYDQADYKVDTTEWSPLQIVEDICRYLRTIRN